MIDPVTTQRFGILSTVRADLDGSAKEAAKHVLAEWGAGNSVDLPEILRECPALTAQHSLVLDLIQRDYYLLRDKLSRVDYNDYVDRFRCLDNGLLQSIRLMVEVEAYFEANPGLLEVVAEPNWPCVGETIAGAVLEYELTRTAVSRVYVGTQPSLGGRRVVVKVARYSQHEASLLGQLDHPNVVSVYQTGSMDDERLSWICMQYLGEQTLQAAIAAKDIRSKRTSLFGKDSIAIAAAIVSALRYVHDQGIIHGDLKSSNVLLVKEKTPVLIDFNLAQDAHSSQRLLGGTLPYMAPEQLVAFIDGLESNDGSASQATDVFSFGVLFYELVTGDLPFGAPSPSESLPETAQRIIDNQAQLQKSIANGLHGMVPRSIPELIERCVAGNPQERPQDFAEIEQALRTAEASWNRSRLANLFVPMAVPLVGAAALLINEPSGSLTEAKAQMGQGNYRAAVSLLREEWETRNAPEIGWLLAEADIQSAQVDEALEVYLRLCVDTRDPSAYAMAGYCQNLKGDHVAAIASYEKAIQSGLESPEVLHNLAKCLMIRLHEHFDSESSAAIAKLLLKAYRLAPENEAVRLAMFSHARDAKRSLHANPPSYPIEITQLPSDDVSTPFLLNSLRFLSSQKALQEEVAEYAFPLYARLKSVMPQEEIETVLRPHGLAAIENLPGATEVVQHPAFVPGSTPPMFCKPLNKEKSSAG